jgi:hypothetical protein
MFAISKGADLNKSVEGDHIYTEPSPFNKGSIVGTFLIVTWGAGNTKGGSITVLLTSCLTGLESAV